MQREKRLRVLMGGIYADLFESPEETAPEAKSTASTIHRASQKGRRQGSGQEVSLEDEENNMLDNLQRVLTFRTTKRVDESLESDK